MKRVTLYVLAIVALFSFLPATAAAHVLKSDGSIGAVLHIDPADDPVVGQASSFYFEFKDKKNQFRPELCNCQAVIQENGKTISEQQLGSTTSISFTFPERNVYQVKVSGMPNQAGDFQPFNLTYDIRVSRTSDATGKKSVFPIILYGVFAATVLGFIVLMLKGRKKAGTKLKRDKSKKDEEKIY